MMDLYKGILRSNIPSNTKGVMIWLPGPTGAQIDGIFGEPFKSMHITETVKELVANWDEFEADKYENMATDISSDTPSEYYRFKHKTIMGEVLTLDILRCRALQQERLFQYDFYRTMSDVEITPKYGYYFVFHNLYELHPSTFAYFNDPVITVARTIGNGGLIDRFLLKDK